MVDAFCDRLTNLIKNNLPDINDEKAEIINFGIKSIVSSTSKIFVILLLAYLLGVLNYAIITIVGFGIYRMFAHGAHASKHITCLLASSLMVFSNVYLSRLQLPYVEVVYLFIYLFNCMVIYLYAPADVEEKPILSVKIRKRLKKQSFLVMTGIFVVGLWVIKDEIITNVLVFSTFFETLTLLPITYKIMGCKPSNGVIIN